MKVFDASVAVKWFRDETGSLAARNQLTDFAGEIVVPDLFVIEVVGALVRQANMAKAARPEAEAHIDRLLRLFELGSLRVEGLTIEQFALAATLAMDLGHPLKDCLYLVLAMDLEGKLVTADTRFAVKAREAYAEVQVIGE